jgi:hypothetical protein
MRHVRIHAQCEATSTFSATRPLHYAASGPQPLPVSQPHLQFCIYSPGLKAFRGEVQTFLEPRLPMLGLFLIKIRGPLYGLQGPL